MCIEVECEYAVGVLNDNINSAGLCMNTQRRHQKSNFALQNACKVDDTIDTFCRCRSHDGRVMVRELLPAPCHLAPFHSRVRMVCQQVQTHFWKSVSNVFALLGRCIADITAGAPGAGTTAIGSRRVLRFAGLGMGGAKSSHHAEPGSWQGSVWSSTNRRYCVDPPNLNLLSKPTRDRAGWAL